MNKKLLELAVGAGYGNQRWNSTEEFEEFLSRYGELVVEVAIAKILRTGILEDIELESDMIADSVRERFGVE